MKLKAMWPKNITLMFFYTFPKYIQALSHQPINRQECIFKERLFVNFQILCN